ncbi:hypothetical protein [Phenylobacterium sp.]|uniref:hypothetical protein n=1 Tax=Phenylobacterium sp. TaxID=1871053 RepID=UPI002BE13FF6|nr:hypothetical protein [Phenylobacterium sp.]HLZ77131.1 hypothetical protein [Phenylobacterium sp.]
MSMTAFVRSKACIVVAWSFALLAVLPLVFTFVRITGSGSDVGEWRALFLPYLNSLMLAVLVSMAATAFGLALILIRHRMAEAVLIIAACLVAPAEFQFLGMDQFAASLRRFGLMGTAKYAGLLCIMLTYILPFVLSTQLFLFRNIGRSRIEALSEYVSGDIAYARKIVSAYYAELFGSWLVGITVALMEVPRSRYMAVDLFGLGSEYFGPSVASAYTTQGIDKVHFIFTVATTAMVAGGIMLVNRRRGRMRPEHRKGPMAVGDRVGVVDRF